MPRHPFNDSSPRLTAGITPPLSLRQFTMALRDRWLGGLALALAAGALVGWLQLRHPPVYQSNAVLVYSPPASVLSQNPLLDRYQRRQTMIELASNAELLVTSNEMLDLVVQALSPAEQDRVTAPYAQDRPTVSDPGTPISPIHRILRGSIRTNQVEESTTLRLSAQHRDPEIAALLANTFAEQYMRLTAMHSASEGNSAVTFLDEQARELAQKLEENEGALQTYREKFNLVSLEEKQNIVVDRLKALSSAVTQARVKRISTETELEQAKKLIADGGAAQEIAQLTQNNALRETVAQIDKLTSERTVMAQKYGRRHPQMEANQRQLEALENLRHQQLDRAINDLANRLANERAHENQLVRELADSETENLRLDQVGVRYNVLRREVDTTRATYSQILSRLNQARISAQLEADVLRIGSRAFPNFKPVKPDRLKVLVSTCFVGLLCLLGYPAGMELLLSRVRSWSDVEDALGSTVLAELADFRKIPTIDRAHLILREVDDDAREAIRALYAQLQLTSPLKSPKVILITSTLPSEGKSFVAANLAAAFSSHNRRTLIIDGDLRRPTQHRLWDLENNRGLLTWLRQAELAEGPADPDDPELGIRQITPNLHFLSTGGVSRDLTELGETGGRLEQLIQDLRQKYQLIIIDSPPAGVFPDALTLARMADELIFVARFNKVTRRHAHQTFELLRRTGCNLPGVVLNGMPSGRTGALYYSSYGYNYHGSKYRNDYSAKHQDHDAKRS